MDLDLAALTSDSLVLMGLALLLRAVAELVKRLGEEVPKIADAVTKALTKRAEARRLDASANRIGVTATAAALEREANNRAELEGRVRGMQVLIAELGDKLGEQGRLATHEIEEAHRGTASAMGALEQLRMDAAAERVRCDRALSALRDEMEQRIDQITSGHSTPARRTT